MTWHIPNQRDIFLTCSDPELKDIRYISFSGYKMKGHEVFYADCPIDTNAGC